jgi:hypothetical protein
MLDRALGSVAGAAPLAHAIHFPRLLWIEAGDRVGIRIIRLTLAACDTASVAETAIASIDRFAISDFQAFDVRDGGNMGSV